MMNEPAITGFRRGEKIQREFGESVDFANLRILLMHPQPVEETGLQEWYTGYVQCPWCGHVGWAAGLNLHHPVDLVCGHCGRYFKA